MRRTLAALVLFTACLSGVAGAAERISVEAGGRQRSALIQAPSGHGPFPTIILLHGGTQDAAAVWEQTSLPARALAAGYVLAAPDAIDKNWNDGRRTLYGGRKIDQTIDDVGFIRALIDRLEADGLVDSKRVFVTGASNGGMMSFRLACELSDRIVAIAPFIATMLADAPARCKPVRRLRVMLVVGTQDPLVAYEGGRMKAGRGEDGEMRLSAHASAEFWAARNGCGHRVGSVALPARVVDDPTSIRINRWADCPANGGVALVSVVGGGHTWPNGPKMRAFGRLILGATTRQIDAGETIMDFFDKSALP
ncbi:MAG: dienelactone hydrolase family protein [Alphaproteobacteria bacterium]|nr:dienelactone hydrolase family protein [Alphaproteobacteria bacterium]